MNFGDLFDYVDEKLNPETEVLIEESQSGNTRILTAAEFKDQTNKVARQLIAMGGQSGDKVAIYSRNRAEYLVAVVGAVKARMVYVNVNFRYRADELLYLLDNSDATIVIFESEFSDIVGSIRPKLTKVSKFIEVTDEQSPREWAVAFDALLQARDGSALDIQRSAGDLFFTYTGGTTGMPKGVMWEQSVLWNMIGKNMLDRSAAIPLKPEDIDIAPEGGAVKNLVIMPFMHGSGIYSSINSLGWGNKIVLLRSDTFDADLALKIMAKHRIASFMIAGDAFAKPLIDALDARPDHYDLSALKVVNSSAMVFSPHNKKRLLAHCPHIVINDNVGSSESSASAFASVTKDTPLDGSALVMNLTPNAKVFSEDLTEVLPGSGGKGFLAVSGNIPLGYYKDAKKTAETFITVDGVRYSRPGDWVEVLDDGSIKFLGRGNVSINTGGEKVYPEEVESALKSHSSVEDCLIVGVPDERFGHLVTAVVKLNVGWTADIEGLKNHIRAQLSGYKVPRHIIFTDEVFRGANGKADYPATKAYAEKMVLGR
jgi:acyl-CoA synthetase (AMP-forming)/AMP-acid ligase II